MITAVIIDDNQVHIDSILKMLNDNFQEIEIIGTAHDVDTAIVLIHTGKPDLVFMDVELGSLTGFDVLHQLPRRNFEVIFTTAYDKYAIQAFRESALDFLTKPVKFEELKEAVNKLEGRIKLKENAALAERNNLLIENLLRNIQSNQEDRMIALTNREGTFLIVYKDIIRLASNNAKTTFYIYKKIGKAGEYYTIEVSGGIGMYEEILKDTGFFYRIHNEHIINVHQINKFEKGESAGVVMHGVPAKFLSISKGRLKGFIEFMKEKGTKL